MITDYKKGLRSCSDVTTQDVTVLEKMITKLSKLHRKWQTIFMWQDGPLVRAMKDGDLFLVDEISLADDSVLERLNSVLEPERKLVSDSSSENCILFCGQYSFVALVIEIHLFP